MNKTIAFLSLLLFFACKKEEKITNISTQKDTVLTNNKWTKFMDDQFINYLYIKDIRLINNNSILGILGDNDVYFIDENKVLSKPFQYRSLQSGTNIQSRFAESKTTDSLYANFLYLNTFRNNDKSYSQFFVSYYLTSEKNLGFDYFNKNYFIDDTSSNIIYDVMMENDDYKVFWFGIDKTKALGYSINYYSNEMLTKTIKLNSNQLYTKAFEFNNKLCFLNETGNNFRYFDIANNQLDSNQTFSADFKLIGIYNNTAFFEKKADGSIYSSTNLKDFKKIYTDLIMDRVWAYHKGKYIMYSKQFEQNTVRTQNICLLNIETLKVVTFPWDSWDGEAQCYWVIGDNLYLLTGNNIYGRKFY
ncbi:MAG: hypothetical protein ACEQSR_03245 [Candidatus Methylacidiphilales bacterium]